MLNDLEYIQSISLCLYKNKEPFLFEEASSGEKHYIFEMSSIVRSIKKHSLILVDEPELSMHPNWQIKYVKTLGKIFSEYRSCHFVISTHSHYIVSDIDPNSSALVSLEYIPEHKKREAILIPYSTYAWSADNILYNVFKVRTTRNWYFEQDIRKLIKYIETKSQEKLDITQLIYKLSKYQLNNDDPLIKLIEEGKRYADLL
jgi:predicted ATP-binding protein involved in virulence